MMAAQARQSARQRFEHNFNLSSLRVLADAMDWHAIGPQPQGQPQVAAAPKFGEHGSSKPNAQHMLGGDCSDMSAPAWTDVRPSAISERKGGCGAGLGVRGGARPGPPVSWRCTEVAGDCTPWLPQWHRHAAGAAGQPMHVPHIH